MQKELPDGLILRSLSEGHMSDQERLPDLFAAVNGADSDEQGKDGVRQWTRDLMYNHPTTTLDDIFVVVDPAKDDLLVSATLLIPQTWRYEDILIGVGRPELVATIPEYRNRGLIRALFEVIHERSAALGHHLQAITGLAHFYRQFGYTMAVDLAIPHAVFQLVTLPKPNAQPAYTLRPATVEDIPALSEWNAYLARERLLTDAPTPDIYRYEIGGYQVIVNTEGRGVGYIRMQGWLNEDYEAHCESYVVGDQASYVETFEDVMQAIKSWAIDKHGHCPAMLTFRSGLHDSLDRIIERSRGGHMRRNNFTWFIRVTDTIDFLKTIRPVLERRLEGSGAHRYTGELRIGYYDQTGICLKFEGGRLLDVGSISGADGYHIYFPWNMFWNVLFGYQTCEEILTIAPDDFVSGKTMALMEILFPKKKSAVHELG